jgi:aspartate/methionine/tyrosine aminotransferase
MRDRFPTYEAEERRSRALPDWVEPVPLHGTPAPALPDHVVAAVAAMLRHPMKTPPARGLAPLREALALELQRAARRAVDPETEILVTNGAMQALGVCFRSVLQPGDEVVVPAPCFFFEGPVRAAGAVPVYAQGSRSDGWRWDVAAVEQAIGNRTRALLLCNPGNPTGYVPRREDVAAVVALAEEHDLLVVTDEAYEASLWEDAVLTSAFELAANVIVIRSLGKSLSLPQLRIGLLAGPAVHVESCARTLEWDCLRIGIAAQEAALAALTGPRDWLDEIHSGMAAARLEALDAVGATPGLEVVVPLAAPFLFVSSDGRHELAEELTAVGLPVVDGAHFQAPGYARLPFGGAIESSKALRRALSQWSEQHRAQQQSSEPRTV